MSDQFCNQNLNVGRCCQGDLPDPLIDNRPDKRALDYRIGTYDTFLKRMLRSLPRVEISSGQDSGFHPLAALGTRDPDDPAIAILDAWAVTIDVLTFYQERIANEGYLRTATERRSILELARAVGYELSPGAAASTYLAFTVEDLPGSPGAATIPKGTKVQSIPGQGQLPQIFETSYEIIAQAKWNSLRPRTTLPQPLDSEMATIYIDGLDIDLKKGGYILFVSTDSGLETSARTIKSVTLDEKLKRTKVELEENSKKPPDYSVFKPDRYDLLPLKSIPLNKNNVQEEILKRAWEEKDLTAFIAIQGWDERMMMAHISRIATKTASLASSIVDTKKAIKTDNNLLKTFEARAEDGLQESLAEKSGLYAFRVQLGPFGHNAPRWDSLPKSLRVETDDNGGVFPYPNSWDDPPVSIIDTSEKNKDTGKRIAYQDADFFLERTLPDLMKDDWILLKKSANTLPCQISSVVERSLGDFSLSAKATGVTLKYPIRCEGFKAEGKQYLSRFPLRSTTIFAQSRPLQLALLSIEDDIGAGTAEESQITLDRMVMGLNSGQAVAITGECRDLEGVIFTEVVLLTNIVHKDGLTTLFFDPKLEHAYIRSTLTINCNLAAATHGATIHEVLGSGDGSLANQKFILKKPPLTYVPSSNSEGRESTLYISVNGIAWKEVSQLYGQDGQSESFIVRIGDDQKATVIFGDGKMGARPATGTENIIAAYRSGIGRAGMLERDKLTLLPARPLGVSSVTNPLATIGANEPESRDQARSNAPRSVQILERIVSLQDFEDFSRAFPGIGKARAFTFDRGEERIVHITVAATEPMAGSGSSFSPATHLVSKSSLLCSNLVKAIRAASDSIQQFVVDTYQPLFFNLSARLSIDPRFDGQSVLAKVEEELKKTFSFESRDFGQMATAAEAIAVMQKVPGVVAVYLDKFFIMVKTDVGAGSESSEELALDQVTQSGTLTKALASRKLRSASVMAYQSIGFDAVLEARDAEQAGEKWRLAELLLINPLGIDLKAVQL
jgi:predicted phage baseplate assembly protein